MLIHYTIIKFLKRKTNKPSISYLFFQNLWVSSEINSLSIGYINDSNWEIFFISFLFSATTSDRESNMSSSETLSIVKDPVLRILIVVCHDYETSILLWNNVVLSMGQRLCYWPSLKQRWYNLFTLFSKIVWKKCLLFIVYCLSGARHQP